MSGRFATWPGVGKPVEVRAVPGQRKVEVKRDGFATFGEVVTVKADGSEEIMVRLEPLVVDRAPRGVEVAPESKRVEVPPTPVPTHADCLQPGSVWQGEPGNTTFTILERQGERFKARFEAGGHVRELYGTIKDGRLRWLARDVKVIAGNAGGDNEGQIMGDEVAMTYSDPGGPTRGKFTLRVRTHGTPTPTSGGTGGSPSSAGKAGNPPAGEPPAPPESGVRDGARMFGSEAIRRAEEAFRRVEARAGLQIVIETVESLGGENIADRALANARSSRLRGLYVLMARQEKKLQVQISRSAERVFNRDRLEAIDRAFVDQFRSGRFDQGLFNGVDLIEKTAGPGSSPGG
jgi:hypothetical protein